MPRGLFDLHAVENVPEIRFDTKVGRRNPRLAQDLLREVIPLAHYSTRMEEHVPRRAAGGA